MVAPAVVNVSSGSWIGGYPLNASFNHDATGADLLLVFAYARSNNPYTANVSFSSSPMTLVTQATGGTQGDNICCWVLAAPQSGLHAISITLQQYGDVSSYMAVSLSGANQNHPIGNWNAVIASQTSAPQIQLIGSASTIIGFGNAYYATFNTTTGTPTTTLAGSNEVIVSTQSAIKSQIVTQPSGSIGATDTVTWSTPGQFTSGFIVEIRAATGDSSNIVATIGAQLRKVSTQWSVIGPPAPASIILKSINWFGGESILFPGGLFARPYKTITITSGQNAGVQEGIIDHVKRLGFNCFRMQICEDITWPNRRVTTSDYIHPELNPDLYTSLSPVPTDTPHPDNYLPVIQIFDKILDYCNKVGMRVILDCHCLAPNADNVIGGGGRWYTTTNPGDTGATAGISGEPRSEQQWIDAWKFLANRYKNNSAVIGFDLMNEPHASTWDNNANTGWPAAVERCANQVHQINPNLLIFVEGVAGNIDFTGVSGGQVWGSLWSGNLTGVATRPITLNVPNKVVYSPHEYATSGAGSPPWLSDSHFPAFMPGIWRTAWGYIAEQNIAPLWIGEFGANFAGGGSTIDNQWITALCTYMIANKISFAYWALNPGGTPNGILSGNDWVNVIQEDLDRIATILAQ